MAAKKEKVYTVEIAPETKAALDKYCARKGTTRRFVVNKAVMAWVMGGAA